MVQVLVALVFGQHALVPSLPFEETTLSEVAKFLREKSSVEVTVPRSVKDRVIFVHWERQPIDALLRGLAYSLGMKAVRNRAPGSWSLSGAPPEVPDELKRAVSDALSDNFARALPFANVPLTVLRDQSISLFNQVREQSKNPTMAQSDLEALRRKLETVRNARGFGSFLPLMHLKTADEWTSLMFSGRIRESASPVPINLISYEGPKGHATDPEGAMGNPLAVVLRFSKGGNSELALCKYDAKTANLMGMLAVREPSWTNPYPLHTPSDFPLLKEHVPEIRPQYVPLGGSLSVEILPAVAANLHRSVAVWCGAGDVNWTQISMSGFTFSRLLEPGEFSDRVHPARAAFNESDGWIRLSELPDRDLEYNVNWTGLLPFLRSMRAGKLSIDQIGSFVMNVPEHEAEAINDIRDERPTLSKEDHDLLEPFLLVRAFFRLPAVQRRRVSLTETSWLVSELPQAAREDVREYLISDGRGLALFPATHPDFERVMGGYAFTAVISKEGNQVILELCLHSDGLIYARIPIAPT